MDFGFRGNLDRVVWIYRVGCIGGRFYSLSRRGLAGMGGTGSLSSSIISGIHCQSVVYSSLRL